MRTLHLVCLACLVTALTGMACAQNVVGEMYASDASVRGSVLFAGGGTKIESGSSVTAGDAPAVLRLTRGGDVRICPQTTVSVTASNNSRDLLMGMNTGSFEAHYRLETSSDAIMTPDFRILLAGPGLFHFAIHADARGNACIRTLDFNTASLIVTELNGDGTYQVRPTEQVIFHNGKVSNPDALVPPDCGCPSPAPPVVRAQPKLEQKPIPLPPAKQELAQETHVEMEAPFVYQAKDAGQEVEMAVVRLRLTSGSMFADSAKLPPPPILVVEPKPIPVAPPKPVAKKGFFGKMRAFFGALFR